MVLVHHQYSGRSGSRHGPIIESKTLEAPGKAATQSRPFLFCAALLTSDRPPRLDRIFSHSAYTPCPEAHDAKHSVQSPPRHTQRY